MRSGVMAFMRAIVSSGSSTLVWSSRICPLRRSVGGLPTARCRSLAFFFTTVSRRRSIWIVAIGNSSVVRDQLSVGAISTSDDAFDLRHLHDFFGGRRTVQDLQTTVGQQALHSAGQGGLADLVGGGALEGERADLVVELHHLEDADAAAEADAVAVVAAARLVQGLVLQVALGDARELEPHLVRFAVAL